MHARSNGTCIELLSSMRRHRNTAGHCYGYMHESWRLNFINQCLQLWFCCLGQPTSNMWWNHSNPSVKVLQWKVWPKMKCAKNDERFFAGKSKSSLQGIVYCVYYVSPICAGGVRHQIVIDLFDNILLFPIFSSIAFHSWRFFCVNFNCEMRKAGSRTTHTFRALDSTDTSMSSLRWFWVVVVSQVHFLNRHSSQSVFAIERWTFEKCLRATPSSTIFRSVNFHRNWFSSDFPFVLNCWCLQIAFELIQWENVAFIQLPVDMVEENIFISVETVWLF